MRGRFAVLRREGLVTWAALEEGLLREWLTPPDVADYARQWLAERRPAEAAREPLLRLAACEDDSAEDVRRWLADARAADAGRKGEGGEEEEESGLDVWRDGFAPLGIVLVHWADGSVDLEWEEG